MGHSIDIPSDMHDHLTLLAQQAKQPIDDLVTKWISQHILSLEIEIKQKAAKPISVFLPSECDHHRTCPNCGEGISFGILSLTLQGAENLRNNLTNGIRRHKLHLAQWELLKDTSTPDHLMQLEIEDEESDTA